MVKLETSFNTESCSTISFLSGEFEDNEPLSGVILSLKSEDDKATCFLSFEEFRELLKIVNSFKVALEPLIPLIEKSI